MKKIWICTGQTIQLHASTKMDWDFEKILEAEVDRQQSWLTEYEYMQ